jgi:hypothetical protein
MLITQPSSKPLRLNLIITGWHKLIKSSRDTYRPELHYMRGPGPKWYAKHQVAPKVVRLETRRLEAR